MKPQITRILRSIVLIFYLIPVMANAGADLTGSVKLSNSERSVGEFISIDLGLDANLFIFESQSPKVIVETDEALLPSIVTAVDLGELKIYAASKIKKPKLLNIYVTSKELLKITLKGKVEIKVYHTGIDKLDIISESDKTNVEFSTKVRDFTLNFLGQGTLKINGLFDALTLFTYNDSKLYLDVNAKVINGQIKDFSYGQFAGICESMNLTLSDEASVNALKLITKNCNVSLNESSEAYINASTTLKINGLGESYLEYAGDPSIQIESDKLFKIKHKADKFMSTK